MRLIKVNNIILFLIIITILFSCGVSKRSAIRSQKVHKVIQSARTYIGTPYKWGGNTKFGIDCSGLLCNSFKSVGYTLPRTSAMQSKVGKKIGIDELKKGDLVFFATGDKKRKITHVGLVTQVIRQKVKFIHSSSSLGVVETNLNNNYYLKRFRYARRPDY